MLVSPLGSPLGFLTTVPQGFFINESCPAHKARRTQPQILKHAGVHRTAQKFTGFHRISQIFTELHRLVCEDL